MVMVSGREIGGEGCAQRIAIAVWMTFALEACCDGVDRFPIITETLQTARAQRLLAGCFLLGALDFPSLHRRKLIKP